MRTTVLLTLLFLSSYITAQTGIDSLLILANEHYESRKYYEARQMYEKLKLGLDKGSQTYNYVADQIAMTYFATRDELRNNGEYEESISYLLSFMQYIESEKDFIRPLWYQEKRYFIIKSIIQDYFALHRLDDARKYQDILYSAYRARELPKGINQCYSFEMFRFEDKNIWAYEWYAEPGDPEAIGSYSKIVYYVYSTDENGHDKEQLYRLHVVRVHHMEDEGVYYVLARKVQTADNVFSGTLWNYTYGDPIDYASLKNDIMEILTGKLK